MTIGCNTLIHLLGQALEHTRNRPPEVTLTLHLAERDGHLVAAAVVDELRVSAEWTV